VPKTRSLLIACLTCLTVALPTAASARTHRHHHHRSHHHRARTHRAGAASTCPNANAPANQTSFDQLRAAVVCLINKQRTARGLPALHHSLKLDHSAQGWTNAMVNRSFFSHGANFAARITAVGFVWSIAGENIATGFLSPSDVVQAWMHSPEHCRNILSPAYAFVGTGVRGDVVSGFGSGAGTWTQDFALPMGHRQPSGNWGPANHC
jgi:uncharacterized protein YkwD